MDNKNNELDKLNKLEAKFILLNRRSSTMDLISNDKSICDNYSTSTTTTSVNKLKANKRNSLSCSLNDLTAVAAVRLNTQLSSSSRTASLTSAVS